jgi:deoxycytidine triphosphate deaminase
MKITVVFVSSTGNAVLFMRGRSSWSRCGSVVEVGDVSFEDGLKILLMKAVPEKLPRIVFLS